MVVLHQLHLVWRRSEHPGAGQPLRVRLARIDHRLELGVGDQDIVYDPRRQERPVGRRRRRDGRHRARLDERGGMRRAVGQAHATQGVGLVETDLMPLSRPGAGGVGEGGRVGQERQPLGWDGLTAGPGRQQRRGRGDPERPEPRRGAILDGRRGRRRVGQRRARAHLRDGRGRVAAVDHQEAGLDRGPVPGVGAGRQGHSQDDAAPARQPAHLRAVVEQPRRHDRGQAAAVGQAVQGRMEVLVQLLEGRVHHRDFEGAGGRQDVFQAARVVRGGGREREQALEQAATAGRDLVERHLAPAGLGQDGEEGRCLRRAPGPCRLRGPGRRARPGRPTAAAWRTGPARPIPRSAANGSG